MQIRRLKPNPSLAARELSYQVAAADDRPRHILEEIVWHKQQEDARMREKLPEADLQHQLDQCPPTARFPSRPAAESNPTKLDCRGQESLTQ